MSVRTRITSCALIAALAVLGGATSAHATLTITYTTTGAFDNTPTSPGTSPVTLGTSPGVTLTFTGLTGSVDLFKPPFNNSFSNAAFGDFQSSTGNLTDLAGHTFTLYITQTVPTPDTPGSPSTTFNATLTGQIITDGSTAFIHFNNPLTNSVATSSGTVFYTVPSTLAINPTTTMGGKSSLQGQISAVVAPEPATLAIAFSALPLLGLGLWRRRKARA